MLSWVYDTASSSSSSVAAIGIPSVDSTGDIYFVLNNGPENYAVYSINSNGAFRWKREIPLNSSGGGVFLGCGEIAVDQSLATIYVSGTNTLKAFNTSDGVQKWVAQTGSLSPVVENSLFTIEWSSSSPLFGLNPANGQRWITSSAPTAAEHPWPPVKGQNGDIYVAGDNRLSAFHADGQFAWSRSLPGNVLTGQPTVGSDGTIYVTSWNSNAFHLNAIKADGTDKFGFQSQTIFLNGSPAIGNDGVIYVASSTHGIVAFDSVGVKLWDMSGGSAVRALNYASPLIAPDGMIYLLATGDDNNAYLYAIYSSSAGPANSSWLMLGANAQHTHVSGNPSVKPIFQYPVGFGECVGHSLEDYRVDFDMLDPKYKGLHTGEDWNRGMGDDDLGDPVCAVGDGDVVASGSFRGWSNIILIRHPMPDGTYRWSQYAHLDERLVQGGAVKRGQRIGTIGKQNPKARCKQPSGENCAHLHFEIRKVYVAPDNWPRAESIIRQQYVDPTDISSDINPETGFIELPH